MSKARIFVSSTCFDLAAVREDLRQYISDLGHDPILSEYASFPVNPTETAIANCRKNVETLSDVLVLIIAGRSGCLDANTGKSVTNLEYETAQNAGIPCFVFVHKPVNGLFPVWKKNPTADFTPSVESPQVFAFLERIREKNHWIFQFEKTAEIKQVLSVQLSTMLRDLIGKNRAGHLETLTEFKSETVIAQQLVKEKPLYWEYRLTAELLTTKLREVRRRYKRIRNGAVYRTSKELKPHDVLPFMRLKLKDLDLLTRAITAQVPFLTRAWEAEESQPNPLEIQKGVEELIQLANQLAAWEEDFVSLQVPQGAKNLMDSMKGWADGVLATVEDFPAKLLEVFKEGAQISKPVDIQLRFSAIPIEDFNKAMEKLEKEPLSLFR